METFAFDLETHLIKPGLLAPKLVCLSWCDDLGVGLQREQSVNWFRHKVMSGIRVVGHNVAFDVGVLCAEDLGLLLYTFNAYEQGRILCTQVRQQLIDISNGELKFRRSGIHNTKTSYHLADLMQYYFKEHLEKVDTWRLKYALLDSIHIDEWPEEAKRYAMDDAEATWRVYQAQEMRQNENIIDEIEQTKAAWALHLMGMWGIRTDGVEVARFFEESQNIINKMQSDLQGSNIFREDGTKNLTEIRRRVEESLTRLSVEIPRTGKTNAVSTSEETLKLTDDDLLHKLADSLSTAKHLSTWGPTLQAGTASPICARFNVLVETGRTSCGNPNWQNPPRKGTVRNCVIPRAGFVFCSVDYDTIELRGLAQVNLDFFQKSKMADILLAQHANGGPDLHVVLAAALLQISETEAHERYKAGDVQVEEARQLAKVANFGFPGGLGAESFVAYAAGQGINVSLSIAQAVRSTWFDTFPEMREYFQKVGDKITSPMGEGTIEQVRSGRVRGGVTFCSAANGYFQGLVADGAKNALWDVSKECYVPGSVLYGARPVLFIHDEIILEVPEERAHEVARRQEEVMIVAMKQYIPDVPITASAVLTRRWYKGAKPVVLDGKLVPVRPDKQDKKVKWVHDNGE